MIHITQTAWQYIRAAIMFRPDKEVAFFGKVALLEDRLLVSDILVPPQEVGGAHAELDVYRGDLDWLFAEIVRKGDRVNDWRFWGHSHGTMATSPSSTDHNTLKMLARQFGGWACGAVFNSRTEITGWAVAPHGLFSVRQEEYTGLTVTIDPHIDAAIEATVNGWMEHVALPTPIVITHKQSGYSKRFGNHPFWSNYVQDPVTGAWFPNEGLDAADLALLATDDETQGAATVVAGAVDKRSSAAKPMSARRLPHHHIPETPEGRKLMHKVVTKGINALTDAEWKTFIASGAADAQLAD